MPKESVLSPSGAPTGYVTSLDHLTGILGGAERVWRTYAKRPGFPPKTDKGYDVAAIAAWKAEHIKPRNETSELSEAKKAKTDREIELLDIKIAKERRSVVDRSEVDELHGRLAQRLKAFLYSKLVNEMPPKVAGCDVLTIRQYGQTTADEIVSTLAKDIEQWST